MKGILTAKNSKTINLQNHQPPLLREILHLILRHFSFILPKVLPMPFFGTQGAVRKNFSKAFLDSIEITASDAWTLFASLDIDGDKVADDLVILGVGYWNSLIWADDYVLFIYIYAFIYALMYICFIFRYRNCLYSWPDDFNIWSLKQSRGTPRHDWNLQRNTW